MRLWEFEDNKAAPLNMVFEQDFIMYMRRLKKQKTPYIVANIRLNEVEQDFYGRGSIDETHERLNAFMQSQNATFAPMANGNAFLAWEVSPQNAHLLDQALQVAFPENHEKSTQEAKKLIQLYKLPDDYTKIRQAIDIYINESLAIKTTKNKIDDSIRMLKTERARGVLTAWTVDQIENLVKRIDIHQFIRSQPIYRTNDGNRWERICDETHIGFEELRQKYFPHTITTEPKHLFLEICQFLDSKILSVLTENYNSIEGLPLSLNLSITTVLGVNFAKFVHAIPKKDHKNIGFEIHCGDLMQDFEITLNMIETLHEEGFNIALDGVTPNMLEYFNFAPLKFDAIKINVRKENTMMLDSRLTQKAIMMIDPEKVIFSHCDSEISLDAGLQMGVNKYQGFLIDDLALAQVKKEMDVE